MFCIARRTRKKQLVLSRMLKWPENNQPKIQKIHRGALAPCMRACAQTWRCVHQLLEHLKSHTRIRITRVAGEMGTKNIGMKKKNANLALDDQPRLTKPRTPRKWGSGSQERTNQPVMDINFAKANMPVNHGETKSLPLLCSNHGFGHVDTRATRNITRNGCVRHGTHKGNKTTRRWCG